MERGDKRLEDRDRKRDKDGDVDINRSRDRDRRDDRYDSVSNNKTTNMNNKRNTEKASRSKSPIHRWDDPVNLFSEVNFNFIIDC